MGWDPMKINNPLGGTSKKISRTKRIVKKKLPLTANPILLLVTRVRYHVTAEDGIGLNPEIPMSKHNGKTLCKNMVLNF